MSAVMRSRDMFLEVIRSKSIGISRWRQQRFILCLWKFFTEPWMNLFFKEEADTYRQMHLEDAIAFIPYGCMVDEFQHIVYSNPDLTPDERRCGMEEAWRKNTTTS